MCGDYTVGKRKKKEGDIAISVITDDWYSSVRHKQNGERTLPVF